MSNDLFKMYGKGELDSPASFAAAITPNDSTDLTMATRGIYIGGDGNLSVVTVGDQTVLFSNVVAGSILPIRVKRVMATNTTATNLVGMY